MLEAVKNLEVTSDTTDATTKPEAPKKSEGSYETLREFLAKVGKGAKFALRVPKGKNEKLDQLVLALKNAGVVSRIERFSPRDGSLIITSADAEVLGIFPEIASTVGVEVLPRADLADVEKLLGKPAPGWTNPAIEGEGLCFLVGQQGLAEEVLLFGNKGEKNISAEFLIDGGYRDSFRTLQIKVGSGENGAIPLSYRISWYEWQDGKLTLKSSKEFGREHPDGAQKAAAERLACRGTKEDALSEFVEGSSKYQYESEKLGKAMARYKSIIFRLTGLVLTEHSQSFPKPRQRRGYQDKPIGTSLADTSLLERFEALKAK